MKVNQGIADLDDNAINMLFSFKVDDEVVSTADIDRIFQYARRILDDSPFDRSDIWTATLEGNHAPMVDFIVRGDHAGFGSLMSSIATTPLVSGFMNYFPYQHLSVNHEARRLEATQFIDKAFSLFGYLGLAKVYCPEQGFLDLSDFVDLLVGAFSVTGEQIAPPQAAGGAYGFSTPIGVIALKDVKSIATAYKIQSIGKNFPFTKIAEIGGGLGFLAYYASLLSRVGYYLYDIPTVSIMQAYFLMRSLGPDKVFLYGEEQSDTSVNVCPFWAIFDQDADSTLWVNQDSFPEIDPQIASKYLEHMAKFKSAGLLSINQEAAADNLIGGAQTILPHLISQHDSSFNRIWRCRDFLRAGYVEEFYKIN